MCIYVRLGTVYPYSGMPPQIGADHRACAQRPFVDWFGIYVRLTCNIYALRL